MVLALKTDILTMFESCCCTSQQPEVLFCCPEIQGLQRHLAFFWLVGSSRSTINDSVFAFWVLLQNWRSSQTIAKLVVMSANMMMSCLQKHQDYDKTHPGPFYVYYDLVQKTAQTLVHSINDFCRRRPTKKSSSVSKKSNPYLFCCLIASCHPIGTMCCRGISYQQNSKLCSHQSSFVCLNP